MVALTMTRVQLLYMQLLVRHSQGYQYDTTQSQLNSLDIEQLEEGSGSSSEDEESRRKKISEMFNLYTKVPSPDNSDDEVDPLDSFTVQIEVSRSCELLTDDVQ